MAPFFYYVLGTVFVFFGLVFLSVGSILSGGLFFLIGIYLANQGVNVSRRNKGYYDDIPDRPAPGPDGELGRTRSLSEEESLKDEDES